MRSIVAAFAAIYSTVWLSPVSAFSIAGLLKVLASGSFASLLISRPARKEIDGSLTQNGSLFSAFMDNLPVLAWIKDIEGHYLYINKLAFTRLPPNQSDWLGKTDADFWPGEIAATYRANDLKVIASREMLETIEPYLMNGEQHSQLVTKFPILNQTGAVIMIGGIGADVSATKRAEYALREAEKKYRDIFENAGEGIFQSTPDGRFIAANPALARMHGYESPADLINSCQDITSEIYADSDRRGQFKRLLEEHGVVRGFEHQVIRKDASKIWITVNARVVRNELGEIVCYEGTAQDITERKQSEDQLMKQKEILEKIFNHIPVMINFTDSDGRIKLVNREWQRTLGWSLEEALNEDIDVFAECYPNPEYRQEVLKFIAAAKGEWVDFQTRVRDGSVIDTSWARTELSDGTTIGIGQDITERKRSEESLKLFRKLIDQSSDAIEVLDPDTLQFLDCNATAHQTLGYTREEFLALTVFDIDPVIDQSMAARLVEEIEKSGFAIFESVHRRKDGSTFPVEINAKTIRLERDYRLAVTRDISERKLAQEALHEAEKKYRDIFENVAEGIFQTTGDGRFITANPALARMFGFNSPEELIRERADIPRQHYVERERREEFKRVLEDQGVVRGFEYQAYRKDGSKIWILDDVRAVRDPLGSVLYYEGTSEDITERKRAETRSAAFANLAHKLSGAMTPLDAGQIIAQTAQDLFGWDSCTLDLYDAEHDVIHPMLNVDTIGGKQVDVTPFISGRKPTPRGRRVINHGPELILRKEPFVFDNDVVPFGDKSRRSGAIITAPIRCASQVIGVLSFHSYTPLAYDEVAMGDLQALADHCGEALNRIQAEEQLRESEARYRDLVENSRELICTHDLDGLVLSANRAATEALGLEAADYFREKNLREILTPDALEGFDDYLARIRNDGVASGITTVQTSSGEQRIWEYYTTLRTEGVAAPVVRGMARDITESKRTEALLQSFPRQLIEVQEEERKRIARELHDEIGQVLTAVTLNLQAVRASGLGPTSNPHIDESILVVEDALLHVQNLALELRPSLLDDLGLAAAIRWFADRYARRTGIKTKVATDVQIAEGRLSRELETACFRIVQEALTNAARHADAKTISIHLGASVNEICISIKDDGVGFDVSARNGSATPVRLGLRGMEERALALGGRLEIKSAPARGTEIRAHFPNKEKKSSP
jgi:PAS domain S-box-containing protein